MTDLTAAVARCLATPHQMPLIKLASAVRKAKVKDSNPNHEPAGSPQNSVDIGDFNRYHEPGGSPQGGQFARAEGSESGGEAKQPGPDAGKAAAAEGRAGAAGRPAGGRGRAASPDEAQGRATAAAAGQPSLTGLPAKPLGVKLEGGEAWYAPGPFAKARDVATDYMHTAGLPYDPPKQFLKVDKERAAKIADEYDKMKHAPDDPAVKASYDAMAKETLAQWQAIKKTGLQVEWIKPGQDDPYAASPRLAAMDVIDNNHWWGFPTDLGYGTADPTERHDNPMLQPTGEVVDGRKLVVNDVFRIVHDYFGHFKEGVGFRADGEENAWRSHAAMYSPLARAAMTAETRGQNSWVNYGPHGEKNRTASGVDTVFAPQKIGIMPEWTANEGRQD